MGGFNGMPIAALIAGGAIEAPKFGKSLTDFIGGINDLRYGANFNEDMDKINKSQTITDLDNFKYQDTSLQYRVALSKMLAERRGALAEQEARPIDTLLRTFEQQGNRPTNDASMRKELLKSYVPPNPFYDPEAAPDYTIDNPAINTRLNQFVDKNRQRDLMVRGAAAMQSNPINPFAGMDRETAADILINKNVVDAFKDQAVLAKTSYEVGKETDQLQKDTRFRAEMGQWFNDNPGANFSSMNAAATIIGLKHGASKAAFEDTLKGVEGIHPKMETVEVGTGRGEQKKRVFVDTRSQTEGPQIGGAWIPSAPKQTVNIDNKQGLGEIVKLIPSILTDANSAQVGQSTIGKMKGLLKAGAGGARGYALTKVAPALQLIGIDTKGMNEAQLYQSLATNLGGSMRLQIVGPGPVSEYEQKLIAKVNGGGSTGAAAANELLDHYHTLAQQKIDLRDNLITATKSFAPQTGNALETLKTPIRNKSTTIRYDAQGRRVN